MAPRKTAEAKVEAPQKKYTITIQGKKYPVEEFTAAHLAQVRKIVRKNGPGKNDWEIAGIRAQSEAGEVVKEVIIPDLPDSVITVRSNGIYVWLLEAAELSALLLKITKVFRQRSLEKAIAAGDETAQADHSESIKEIEGIIANLEGGAEDGQEANG